MPRPKGSDVQQFASFDEEARNLLEGGETAKTRPRRNQPLVRPDRGRYPREYRRGRETRRQSPQQGVRFHDGGPEDPRQPGLVSCPADSGRRQLLHLPANQGCPRTGRRHRPRAKRDRGMAATGGGCRRCLCRRPDDGRPLGGDFAGIGRTSLPRWKRGSPPCSASEANFRAAPASQRPRSPLPRPQTAAGECRPPSFIRRSPRPRRASR